MSDIVALYPCAKIALKKLRKIEEKRKKIEIIKFEIQIFGFFQNTKGMQMERMFVKSTSELQIWTHV